MATEHEVIVVGGGVMGSATVWHLARRGVRCLLLERFPDGTSPGASFGGVRNLNLGYWNDDYLDLLARALPTWDELEQTIGVSFLSRRGIVIDGPALPIDHAADRLARYGLVAQQLSAAEASDRWPGRAFTGPALFLPQGGTIDADTAVGALRAAAVANGASVECGLAVHGIRVRDDRVELDVGPGAPNTGTDRVTLHASKVVFTVGAWTGKLLGRHIVLPHLAVSRQLALEFRGEEDPGLPSFNHHPRLNERLPGTFQPGFYGSPSAGGGAVVGWHLRGGHRDPDARALKRVDPRLSERLGRFVQSTFTSVERRGAATSVDAPIANTGDWNFIMDAVGPVVVGTGFGSHGFKFAPAVGAILADLAAGEAAPTVFRLPLHH